jgi:hypothetical protein
MATSQSPVHCKATRARPMSNPHSPDTSTARKATALARADGRADGPSTPALGLGGTLGLGAFGTGRS